MELKHVKIFVLAANLLNFTKVAEFSFLSQSSVTKYIQCLEEELGGKLFLRDGRKTELTELGKLFLPYASSLLDTEQESMAALRSYQSGLERTTFRIGVEDALFVAPPGVFYCVLVSTLKVLRSQHPGVIFDVRFESNSTLQTLLENEQVDIGIQLISDYREDTFLASEYSCDDLDTNGFRLAVSEDTDTSGGYRAVLARTESIVYDIYSLPQNISYALSNQLGVNCASKTYPHWMNLYMEIALSGAKVAAIIADNMKEVAEGCGLKTVPMDDFQVQNGLYCYWKTARQSDLTLQFITEYKRQLEKK